jgi:hypothetical protein
LTVFAELFEVLNPLAGRFDAGVLTLLRFAKELLGGDLHGRRSPVLHPRSTLGHVERSGGREST